MGSHFELIPDVGPFTTVAESDEVALRAARRKREAVPGGLDSASLSIVMAKGVLSEEEDEGIIGVT